MHVDAEGGGTIAGVHGLVDDERGETIARHPAIVDSAGQRTAQTHRR